MRQPCARARRLRTHSSLAAVWRQAQAAVAAAATSAAAAQRLERQQPRASIHGTTANSSRVPSMSFSMRHSASHMRRARGRKPVTNTGGSATVAGAPGRAARADASRSCCADMEENNSCQRQEKDRDGISGFCGGLPATSALHQVSWAVLDVFQGRWRQRQPLVGEVARFT